jgi:kinesin family protein 3/17
MRRGAAVRATGATKMNEISSRSHAVFIIIVEQNETEMSSKTSKSRQTFKVGKLNLVDLAGSERVGNLIYLATSKRC